MRAAYASCASYRDRGNVRTDYFAPSGAPTRSEDLPFSTVFQRPDRFRYEFRGETGGRYIVWREGAAVRTHWDLIGRGCGVTGVARARAGGRHRRLRGLGAHGPLAAASGRVRGGQLAPRRFVDLELVGQTALDGVACHHITAGTARDPTHLWITIYTSLLRRIERRVNFTSFATVSVTDYAAATGLTIGDDEFRFRLRRARRPELETSGREPAAQVVRGLFVGDRVSQVVHPALQRDELAL